MQSSLVESISLPQLPWLEAEPAQIRSALFEQLAQHLSAKKLLWLHQHDGGWQALQQWPAHEREAENLAPVLTAATQAMNKGCYLERLSSANASQPNHTPTEAVTHAAVKLVGTGYENQVIVMVLPTTHPIIDAYLLTLLQFIAAFPAQCQQNQQVQQLTARMDRLFDIVRLAIRLGEERHFMQAALSLCSELAVRYQCERVSLGWLQGGYVRLQTISHIEQFESRMEAAQTLESVMEEAFDQDTEVLWPIEDPHLLTRNHQHYAQKYAVGHLLSLPLRRSQQPEAVLTAERQSHAFTEAEVWELRLIGDAVMARLHYLQQRHKWFLSRWVASIGQGLGRLWGVEHSVAKFSTVLLASTLVALFLIKWPYRVDGEFTLRSEELVFIPAPFDGYLNDVYVEIGDQVSQGDPLLDLKTTELVLEESMAAAEQLRYAREVEKAQGARQLADMYIAQARQAQAEARLALVRHQLQSADVRSPISGFVVEGELKRNLGAPVRQGDLLLKVARIDETFVEIAFDQSVIHELYPDQQGEIAFVGRPDKHYPIRIERIDPIAVQQDGATRFIARARLETEFESWWRPGMGGTAKLQVEERPLIWIWTQRTVRYLRLWLWV